MSGTVTKHHSESATDKRSDESIGVKPLASVRVSPHSYFSALFVSIFFSALIVYLGYDLAAAVLLGVSCVLLPIFAVTDRVAFDGKRIFRTGFLPNAWAKINGIRRRLRLSDIEQVETQATRSIKRGGKVRYRYRTSIRGKGVVLTFASGGAGYRAMTSAIFSRLPENVLDSRSIELRDHLTEPREAKQKAKAANIPPADVLENSMVEARVTDKAARIAVNAGADADDPEKVSHLRALGNELRLAGSLLQALEAFRRAVRLKPNDAWLLFDFARCLQSFAGAEHDPRLDRRAVALMRLAEKRAGSDGELLSRLGESYFQIGEWRRAAIVFGRAIDSVGESFRSFRGMAEIALREGKIAHVIHNFSAANRSAETEALRRWTKSEVEYFSRLNDDEEYMEMEISRVNLLDKLETAQRTMLRATILGFPVIAAGLVFENGLIANVGWAVSTISLVLWVVVLIMRRLLSARIPHELLGGDR